MDFKLKSDFAPMGDQPEAIRQLVEGVRAGQRAQVLQGVTGSGKTFTVANVIQELQRPTLVHSFTASSGSSSRTMRWSTS